VDCPLLYSTFVTVGVGFDGFKIAIRGLEEFSLSRLAV
jgi:hypothetical protein